MLGARDGSEEGCDDSDGASVESPGSLGELEGTPEGTVDGVPDGALLKLGCDDGPTLGTADGEFVSPAALGTTEGEADGMADG